MYASKCLHLYLLILFPLLSEIFAEVTVLKSNYIIYDRSPKLRIRGSSFDADARSIILDLAVNGQSSLIADKDYTIIKDAGDEGLILKLLENRKWADLSGRTPPVALVLTSVKFAANPVKNLLIEPVIIAQVLLTPTVTENLEIIYASGTNELRINGTGFIGSKAIDLYFIPQLLKGVSYDDVTPYPLTTDQIILRLRHGHSWRNEPGPLAVIGIDTGGTPVKLNGNDGFCVAIVQNNTDLNLRGITVN